MMIVYMLFLAADHCSPSSYENSRFSARERFSCSCWSVEVVERMSITSIVGILCAKPTKFPLQSSDGRVKVIIATSLRNKVERRTSTSQRFILVKLILFAIPFPHWTTPLQRESCFFVLLDDL